jgi:hypothetical protein
MSAISSGHDCRIAIAALTAKDLSCYFDDSIDVRDSGHGAEQRLSTGATFAALSAISTVSTCAAIGDDFHRGLATWLAIVRGSTRHRLASAGTRAAVTRET